MQNISRILNICFVFIALTYAAPAISGERFSVAGIENDAQAIEYFNKIKEYVKNEEKVKIADEIVYPINVYIGNKQIRIKDKKSFVLNYGNIVNNKTKCAILNQTSEDLFASWRGVSTSGGELWFSLVRIKKSEAWQFKIIAINN